MARQFRAAAAALLAVSALEGCAEPPPRAAHPETAGAGHDAREAIHLSDAERERVLAEMRLMLEATEGVVAGLAANDMQAVEQAAARAAPNAPATVDRELHALAPEAFLHSGVAGHGGFGDIARLAREGAGAQAVTMRLSETLHQCTSCHAAYRIEADD